MDFQRTASQPSTTQQEEAASHRLATDKTLSQLFEISEILNTGLHKDELATLVSLCEQGVNPAALVEVVKELRQSTSPP